MNGKTASLLLGLLAVALAPTRPAGASTASGPPAQPGHILTDVYGGLVGYNNDGSNQINYTVQSGEDGYPSVSRDGSKIAFASTRNDPSLGHGHNTEIYVMNSDGTGLRQLTFSGTLASGDRTDDVNPVISPDGTKVAFVGFRSTYPNATLIAAPNVWVVNTDGTNLHQVTQTEPNLSGSGVTGSYIYSVAWGPDSHTIAFTGVRGSSSGAFNSVLGMIQDNGSGETEPIVIGPGTGIADCLDWSPNGRYLVYGYGDNAQTYQALAVYDLVAGTSTEIQRNGTLNHAAGTDRFSPDSTHLLVRAGGLYTLNLDGSNVTPITTPNDPGSEGGSAAIWWASGPAIPKPDHLTVSPSPIYVPVGGTVHLLPTLYDAKGNVIVHAVRSWNTDDGRFYISVNNDLTGIAATNGAPPLSVAPDNGGVTAPNTNVYVGTPKLTVTVGQNGRDTANNDIVITLRIANTGDGAATYPTLQTATLNGVAATSAQDDAFSQSPGPLPYTIAGGFGPGKTVGFIIRIPGTAALTGTRGVLKITGNYAGGSFASTLRVTSP